MATAQTATTPVATEQPTGTSTVPVEAKLLADMFLDMLSGSILKVNSARAFPEPHHELKRKVDSAVAARDLGALARTGAPQTFGRKAQASFAVFAAIGQHQVKDHGHSRTPDLDECGEKVEIKAANASSLRRNRDGMFSGQFLANGLTGPGTGAINRILLVPPEGPVDGALVVEGTAEQLAAMADRLISLPEVNRSVGFNTDKGYLALTLNQVDAMRSNRGLFPELMTLGEFADKLNSCSYCG